MSAELCKCRHAFEDHSSSRYEDDNGFDCQCMNPECTCTDYTPTSYVPPTIPEWLVNIIKRAFEHYFGSSGLYDALRRVGESKFYGGTEIRTPIIYGEDK